jgi:hypothetical protein
MVEGGLREIPWVGPAMHRNFNYYSTCHKVVNFIDNSKYVIIVLVAIQG